MTPLAQLHGAVAGEVATATAVVAHRPFGRLLVVLGAVVSVAGLLDLSADVLTSPLQPSPNMNRLLMTDPLVPVVALRCG